MSGKTPAPAPGRDKFDAWLNAKTAPELAALVADILGAFTSVSGDWYLAGVSREQHASWLKRAGLPA